MRPKRSAMLRMQGGDGPLDYGEFGPYLRLTASAAGTSVSAPSGANHRKASSFIRAGLFAVPIAYRHREGMAEHWKLESVFRGKPWRCRRIQMRPRRRAVWRAGAWEV